MGATTPEQIGELMSAAYQAKDAEAIGDLYEDDAILANSGAGYTVVGRLAIVEKVKENLAIDIEWFDVRPMKSLVLGDYAFSHSTFRRRLTLPDGTPQEGEGRSTLVLRRGADGNWRCVIDHA
jgi:uncharacterized protein (TIGR02246 family)